MLHAAGASLGSRGVTDARKHLSRMSTKPIPPTLTGDNPWGLVPDRLPHMEYMPTSPGEFVRLDGIAAEQSGLAHFPADSAALPAGVHVHLLLDRKTLTTAYPKLTVSGGKGSQNHFTYAEALYDKDRHKGDRDAVENRTAIGVTR